MSEIGRLGGPRRKRAGTNRQAHAETVTSSTTGTELIAGIGTPVTAARNARTPSVFLRRGGARNKDRATQYSARISAQPPPLGQASHRSKPPTNPAVKMSMVDSPSAQYPTLNAAVVSATAAATAGHGRDFWVDVVSAIVLQSLRPPTRTTSRRPACTEMDSRNQSLPGVPSALMPAGLTSYVRESHR